MNLVNHPVVKHKLGLLNLAEEIGNVSRASKIMGVSRDTFYRYQEAKAEGDLDALLHKDRRRPNLKNRVDDAVEQAVLAYVREAVRAMVAEELHRLMAAKGISTTTVGNANAAIDVQVNYRRSFVVGSGVTQPVISFSLSGKVILPTPAGHAVKRISYATEVSHDQASYQEEARPQTINA